MNSSHGHAHETIRDLRQYVMLAEQQGVGTRDLARIEVIGASTAEVRFDYRSAAKRA
jgi:hypothetical protein